MDDIGSGGVSRAFLAERERWILWAPVLLGSGIGCYFALSFEPQRWLGPLFLSMCLLAGGLAGARRPLLLLGAIALGLFALGFSLAAERSRTVAAPVLAHPTRALSVKARVSEVEPLEQGLHRLVLDQLTWPETAERGALPTRLRIRLREEGQDWRPGQRLSLRVVLMPPPAPA